jgi:mannose-6-phosphate isomerase-like protein (cupin superfamily)
VLAPPKGGSRLRVIDFPPEGDEIRQLSEDEARGIFSSIGGADASTSSARHPLMHRTETVDYGIVLEGEIDLVVDDAETTIRAGDIVV